MAKKTATAKTATAKKTKATDMPTPAGFKADAQRQFAVNAAYAGLRNMSYAPMVAGAMLTAIGATLEEGQEAATAFGDIK